MKITSVKVDPKQKEGSRMIAKASIVIDDCFAVRDIRIIEGDNGLFIAMPSKKILVNNEVVFRDVAHPINAETRKMFEDAILDEYKAINKTEE